MTHVPAPELSQKRFLELAERASQGDQKAFGELKPALVNNPEVWRELGDLAALTQRAQIAVAHGEDLMAREAARRDLDRLRTELTLPTDGGVERLLIERILTCHLQLAYAETVYIQNSHKLTLDQGTYYQDRIDRAHRRYLSAIKLLATVRKLAQPAIQVNVGAQQVNVNR